MAKPNRSEQIDAIVERLLGHPGQSLLPGGVAEPFDMRFAPVMAIVRALRDLPRPEFKAQLRAKLERRATMTGATATASVRPIPEGFRTVTPYLIAADGPALIEFVKNAFGAEERFRGIGSGGGVHAEVRIGDSMLMIGGGIPGHEFRGTPSPTALHVSVPDVDAAYQRAVGAGAKPLVPPADQDYGSRDGSVTDLWGNQWYVAALLEPREKRPAALIPAPTQTVTVYLHPERSREMVDFLKRAFGAEETYIAQGPDGRVHHAQVRIGSSIVEMGDAHGPYLTMPTTFYMYVENADAAYERAVKAGATSLYPPADQPYGDRNGGVKDPFGNTWYISTHIRDVAG